jgi:hypothetical protein
MACLPQFGNCPEGSTLSALYKASQPWLPELPASLPPTWFRYAGPSTGLSNKINATEPTVR